MGLRAYNRKRNFKKTSEPAGKKTARSGKIFVIQKHDASHLHYDFRLELDGVLKSWAVPKGPSLDPHQRRLAMQVEDHPVPYAKFEGIIPKGEYGGGEVIVWDYGTWKPKGDAHDGYRKGRLEFELKGKKLHGAWILVRTRAGESRAQWLLIKRTDEAASHPGDPSITEAEPQSARTGRLLTRDQLALGAAAAKSVARRAKVWRSNRAMPAKSSKRRPSPRARKPEHATKPDRWKPIEPQLATLVDVPPQGDRWIHEIKFDGYRTLCRLRNAFREPPRLYTRKGLDWSEKYEAFFGELSRIPVKTAVLDGEIVALDEEGRSDFQLLQVALSNEGDGTNLVYYLFDILELNGRDLRDLPLIERKEILKSLLEKSDHERILYSDHWEGTGKSMLSKSCELGLEGMISKDKFAPYSSGRSELWVKSKCLQGQEAIIVGYTAPEGQRIGFGSLVLAAHSKSGDLCYLGRVGTGFDHEKIVRVLREMRPLRTLKSPFEAKVPLENSIQWIRPKLVAEIFFHGWTDEGHVRQAVFRDLRMDKPAKEVKVDFALPGEKLPRSETARERRREKHPSKKTLEAIEEIEGSTSGNEEDIGETAGEAMEAPDQPETGARALKLSNPDKVLIPSGKVTKRKLFEYLNSVSDWILSHVKNRPLALVRCPDDVEHECFFQKNLMYPGKGALKGGSVTGPNGKKTPLVYLDSARGLAELAQMGTIEIHAWGTHLDHPLEPDLLVFDIDPDDSVPWNQVADTALRLKKILEKLGLVSFLKVSGNKGLHLHVPILPRQSWEEVKAFANAVSRILAEENPKLYVTQMTKAKRKGKIFIDFFRNGFGATSVAPYSVRTKNGGAIALPIDWSEVKRVDPKGFHIDEALKRLSRRSPGGESDPWKDYFKVKQKLPGFTGSEKSAAGPAPRGPAGRRRARARSEADRELSS